MQHAPGQRTLAIFSAAGTGTVASVGAEASGPEEAKTWLRNHSDYIRLPELVAFGANLQHTSADMLRDR